MHLQFPGLRPVNAGYNEKTCRAYGASFHESEMQRQAAAGRVDDARVLTALDSVINAFNDRWRRNAVADARYSLTRTMHEVRR